MCRVLGAVAAAAGLPPARADRGAEPAHPPGRGARLGLGHGRLRSPTAGRPACGASCARLTADGFRPPRSPGPHLQRARPSRDDGRPHAREHAPVRPRPGGPRPQRHDPPPPPPARAGRAPAPRPDRHGAPLRAPHARPRPGDVAGSLRATVRAVIARSRFSGVNFLLSDGHRLYAYRLGVFELHWLARPGQLLVASERVTEEDWQDGRSGRAAHARPRRPERAARRAARGRRVARARGHREASRRARARGARARRLRRRACRRPGPRGRPPLDPPAPGAARGQGSRLARLARGRPPAATRRHHGAGTRAAAPRAATPWSGSGARLEDGAALVSATNGKTTTAGMMAGGPRGRGARGAQPGRVEHALGGGHGAARRGAPARRAGALRGRRGVAAHRGPGARPARAPARQPLPRPARPLRRARAPRRPLGRGRGRACRAHGVRAQRGRPARGRPRARAPARGVLRRGGRSSPAPSWSTPSDSKRCRNCGAEYVYDAALLAHLGHYRCPNCGRSAPSPPWPPSAGAARRVGLGRRDAHAGRHARAAPPAPRPLQRLQRAGRRGAVPRARRRTSRRRGRARRRSPPSSGGRRRS